MRFGYKAAAEQFAPAELLEHAVLAEKHGFESVAVSDHFHPFWHTGGHASFALSWLGAAGQRTKRVALGTSVIAPALRYHPALVAQSFATLACLSPGRLFLGMGTGEPINEVPFGAWPPFAERHARLAEAIELIRQLWSGDVVDHEGRFFRLRGARLYDVPEQAPPIYVAASGPKSAELAGSAAAGIICNAGAGVESCRELLAAMERSAVAKGRSVSDLARVLEVKVSFARSQKQAQEEPLLWAPLALLSEVTGDPRELERRSQEHLESALGRWLISTDADEHVAQLRPFLSLGFDHLIFHSPAVDQGAFIRLYTAELLPRLRGQ